MKDNKVIVRTSEEDEQILKQAAENLSVMTNEKPSLSKAIRAGVKILADQDPGKPDLFYVNRQALKDFQSHLEYSVRCLQEIHDEYVRMLGFSPTMTQIESWFGGLRSNFMVPSNAAIKEGILDILFERQRDRYPGLQFSRENIPLPDMEKLFDLCGQLIFAPTIQGREYFFWRCYMIESGKVIENLEEVEALKNGMWRIYADSPEEKARLATVRKLCDILNTIKVTVPSMFNLPGLVTYDTEAGIYYPEAGYVKGLLK